MCLVALQKIVIRMTNRIPFDDRGNMSMGQVVDLIILCWKNVTFPRQTNNEDLCSRAWMACSFLSSRCS